MSGRANGLGAVLVLTAVLLIFVLAATLSRLADLRKETAMSEPDPAATIDAATGQPVTDPADYNPKHLDDGPPAELPGQTSIDDQLPQDGAADAPGPDDPARDPARPPGAESAHRPIGDVDF